MTANGILNRVSPAISAPSKPAVIVVQPVKLYGQWRYRPVGVEAGILADLLRRRTFSAEQLSGLTLSTGLRVHYLPVEQPDLPTAHYPI